MPMTGPNCSSPEPLLLIRHLPVRGSRRSATKLTGRVMVLSCRLTVRRVTPVDLEPIFRVPLLPEETCKDLASGRLKITVLPGWRLIRMEHVEKLMVEPPKSFRESENWHRKRKLGFLAGKPASKA
ncbi:hypothetical protein D3C75_1032540 [compost metagenome]